jgi:hypothetical protein
MVTVFRQAGTRADDKQPFWVDLASVIVGERLNPMAAAGLAVALAAIALATVLLLVIR